MNFLLIFGLYLLKIAHFAGNLQALCTDRVTDVDDTPVIRSSLSTSR